MNTPTNIITPGQKIRLGNMILRFHPMDQKIQLKLLEKIADTISLFQGVEAVLFNKDLKEEIIQ